MDLNRLYHLSQPLIESDRKLNKYCDWAMRARLQNHRVTTMQAVLTLAKESPQDPPPRHVVSFINDHARVLSIYNVLQGRVVQAVLRAMDSHAFLTLTSGFQLPYRIGQLPPSRTYTDPIVVVEGASDADVLATIESNTVACLTSGLSKLNTQILSRLTNHVILAYDSDEAGQKSIRRDRRALSSMGIKVSILQHPSGFKDPGDLATAMLEGRELDAQLAIMHYKTNIRRLKEE